MHPTCHPRVSWRHLHAGATSEWIRHHPSRVHHLFVPNFSYRVRSVFRAHTRNNRRMNLPIKSRHIKRDEWGALNVPVDVAGATFMAIGTSSPELYSAVIGE
ncbi:hypothetical protein TNIN_175401 [Trichonephila inaurata madagascariensis]|uniref:Uncharacterized protein n=1 Tax=Trichonephila inaurata madagascariensis TaxID=2747483 RepID=A0A8X6XMK0_9ARAC|nr:hypothetical protein TNIN_175401 [Trichonephila inaurata madagascariensis]